MAWQFLKKLFPGRRHPPAPRLIIYHPVAAGVRMAERKQVLVQEIHVKKLYSRGTYSVGRGKQAGERSEPPGFSVENNPHTQAIGENHWQFQVDHQLRCWVKDLGTDEGTKVNGILREGAALKHGDVITSGAEEAQPKVAVIFDETGELSEKLSTREEILNYLKQKSLLKGK